MADRRMLTKKVTDDDNFMALSASAQALYLHLSMNADDDGFCNQVSISMFKAHASVQDLQALLEKRYVYQFENGVIVITHWRMANALRKDRYTPTIFKEELAKLQLDDTGKYEPVDGDTVAKWLPNGCQMVASCLPQDRLDKINLDKTNKERENKREKKRFTPPTLQEVEEYAKERSSIVNPERFFDYYESIGWVVSRHPMKDWKATWRNWELRERNDRKPDVDDRNKDYLEGW